MNELELKAAWKEARPLGEWRKKCKREGRKPSWKDMQFVDRKMEAYGDRELYRDIDGSYYEDFMGLGD